jgi:Txe/YoeB family toxin of Txe-Axe toxin-antitoxin module
VIAVKGARPKDGWSGTEKAEETRLKSEFKREVLANSGNAQFTSIAKSGLNNDEKIKIMDTKTKNSSDSQKAEYLSQVVKYEVVKGELFAQYAKDKDLSDRVVYEVVKQSIPVLSAESNNDLLRELRQAGVLSDRSLAQLRNDGLITPAGYSKYRAIKVEEVEQQQSGRIKRPERQYF